MASYLVNPDYEKKRAIIERRKERLQKKIEDLESDAAILDHQIMQYNERLDRLKNRMPLASYQPLRHKLNAEYEIELQQKNALYNQILNIKSQIAEIIYDIEELDLEVTRLSELIGTTDS